MDPVVEALIVQLLRTGLLDIDDLADMAERLEKSGHTAEAYRVKLCILGAHEQQSQADFQADIRRKSIRLVDGGNPET